MILAGGGKVGERNLPGAMRLQPGCRRFGREFDRTPDSVEGGGAVFDLD
jgi:hypothetical protein